MFPRSRLVSLNRASRCKVLRPTIRTISTATTTKPESKIIQSITSFTEQVGCGVTQILFVSNPYIGYGIVGAVASASPLAGLALFSGSFLSILWAHLLGAPPDLIDNGLVAFNGILVSLALTAFLPMSPALPPAIIAGTFVATYLFILSLQKVQLPVLSIPFIAATLPVLCLIPPVFAFGPVPLPSEILLPNPEMITTVISLVPLVYANLFFTSSWSAGAIMIAGQTYLDYKTAISGVCGAAVGLLVGAMLGYDITSGLWGFNAALTAMALYPTFGKPFWVAMVGAAGSALLYPLAIIFWGSFGLPALSTTFCFSTILILYLYQLTQKIKKN